jgi:ribosomal protein S18 acetylase RimI-like enzyme
MPRTARKPSDKSDGRPCIDWLERCDYAAVADIEERALRPPQAWTEEHIRQFIRQRGTYGMSIKVDNKLVGYYFCETIGSTLYVQRFAVDFDYRRQGLASMAVERWKGKLHLGGLTRIYIAMPETWLDALCFLREHGFRAEYVRSQVLDQGRQVDVIAMVHLYDPPRSEHEAHEQGRRRPTGLD